PAFATPDRAILLNNVHCSLAANDVHRAGKGSNVGAYARATHDAQARRAKGIANNDAYACADDADQRRTGQRTHRAAFRCRIYRLVAADGVTVMASGGIDEECMKIVGRYAC